MVMPLYLDYARFGLPPARVRRALSSLAEFSASEGISCRADRLLRDGFSSWPEPHRRLYRGLSDWAGTESLRSSLGRLLAPGIDGGVILAGRSSELMRLAARLLFRRCERVLVTDLEWPGYLRILEEERARTGRALVVVPLRSAVFFDKLTAGCVVGSVASYHREHGCDGAFLSAVSFHGVRVPVGRIVAALRANSTRYVIADASQAFGHLPPGDDLAACDLVLTGCHKWPGAFLPLGVAFCRGAAEYEEVEELGGKMTASRGLDDPLLSFLSRIDPGRQRSDATGSFGETVNLTPLFTAQAAIMGLGDDATVGHEFRARLGNVVRMTDAALGSGWTPVCLQPSVRSGVLLLRASGRDARTATAGPVRERFLEQGVVLTSYDRGFVRLSMPVVSLRGPHLDRLRRALRRSVLAGRAWIGGPVMATRGP